MEGSTLRRGYSSSMDVKLAMYGVEERGCYYPLHEYYYYATEQRKSFIYV